MQVVLFPQTGGNYTDPLSGFSWAANCWDNYGFTSRRRDCHFDDTPCLSILKNIIKVRGGAIE